MNSPIKRAEEIYKQHDGDFALALDWHLAHGVVVSLPTCFLLGYFCRHDDVGTVHPLKQANCVRVTMCVGSLRQAGQQIVDMVPWLAYERETRGDPRVRIVNFKQFYSKLPWAKY